jgi:hypothetical protein
MVDHFNNHNNITLLINTQKGHKDLQLPMQSVPITTDAVDSTAAQGKVYNIM